MGNRLHSGQAWRHPRGCTARVRRLCLVCEFVEDVWEPEGADEIGPVCSRCHAPTERTAVFERRRTVKGANPHAAALVVNGATPGTVTLQWSQRISSGTPAKAGSVLVATKY